MASDFLSRPAVEQAELVRSGEVSSRELVEESLRAIEALNGELNAFVTTTAERALQEADAVEAGDERPLAGVPIAVKDLIALTEGIREALHVRAWPRITRFEDRWRWIVTCIVPRFRRLDLQTPLVDASLRRVFDEARDYASNPCVLRTAATRAGAPRP